MTLPFCFSKCISSHFSSNKYFLCTFPCSHLIFCVLTHILSCLLSFCFVFPHTSLPGSPVCNSHYSHPNMSKQRCLMTLIKVKVLASDIFCWATWSHPWLPPKPPCYPHKPHQLCPLQEIHFSLTRTTESGVSPVKFLGSNSALLYPLWCHQACQPILHAQYSWLTEPS